MWTLNQIQIQISAQMSWPCSEVQECHDSVNAMDSICRTVFLRVCYMFVCKSIYSRKCSHNKPLISLKRESSNKYCWEAMA